MDEVLGTPGIGIGMGTSVTPLFTNIYLDQLDRHLKGRGTSFSRFGDDLALFFADWPSVRQAHRDATRFVSEVLGQEIRETKVTIAEFEHPGEGADHIYPTAFDFCAYRFKMNENNRPVVRIKDDTMAKIKRRIKLLTRVPGQRRQTGEAGRVPTREGEIDPYLRGVIEEIRLFARILSDPPEERWQGADVFLAHGMAGHFPERREQRGDERAVQRSWTATFCIG